MNIDLCSDILFTCFSFILRSPVLAGSPTLSIHSHAHFTFDPAIQILGHLVLYYSISWCSPLLVAARFKFHTPLVMVSVLKCLSDGHKGSAKVKCFKFKWTARFKKGNYL
jgi:hypothetical protein